MKKIMVFTFICVLLCASFYSCKNDSAEIIKPNEAVLLKINFQGNADFTSATYACAALDCVPAKLQELIIWGKSQINLPERTYSLNPFKKNGETYLFFLDRRGIIQVENIAKSNKYLLRNEEISFLAVKNSSTTDEYPMVSKSWKKD